MFYFTFRILMVLSIVPGTLLVLNEHPLNMFIHDGKR